MKKKYILLLLIIINIVGIRYIDAVSYFPEKIILYRYKAANKTSDPSGITIDSNRIVNKTYETTVNNVKISGRAFCSGWKYKVPLYWIECEKKAWVNDEEENKKVSASIGQFIYDLRGTDGISERDYFYGEMAINDFLYQKYEDDVNNIRNSFNAANIKTSETYRKKIENYYNNYGKNTSVKIISVKVNNTDITKANATLNVAENYQLKILVKCSDDNCKNSNVEAKNIQVNGTKISSVSVSKNNNGTETIIVNIPNNIIRSGIGEKNAVNISLNKKIEIYLAQRYGCGEGKYIYNYQPVVPNMLVPDNYSVPLNWDGTFSIENKSEESCEQKITHNTPAQNADLYVNSYPNFSKLLDINDTSCTPISNNPGKIDCDNTEMSYNWVDTVKINNTDYHEYCSASFEFENIAVNDNWGKLGGKIYKTDNGLVGKAIVTYDCNVPSLYNDNNIIHNIKINNFLLTPKLYMKVGNYEKNIVGKIKMVSSDKYNGAQLCRVENDKVSCDNYSSDIKNGFGWAFTATIEYKYPDNMNGFEIPTDAEISNNNKRDNISTIDFDLKETVFKKVEFDERINKCYYGVTGGETVLYRTINYNKPFADYSGSSRKTGSNWCYSGGYELSSNSSCFILGDVDNDGELTETDLNLLGSLVNMVGFNPKIENISEDKYDDSGIKNSACVDVNGDGEVNVGDISWLQNIIIQLKGEGSPSNNDSNSGDISEDEDGTDGCEGDNPKVQKYIMQRPNANGKYKTANNVEKSVDGPLYSIKLTSFEIKKIRSSNKNQGGYNLYSSSINEFIGEYIGAENVQGLCKSSIDGNTNCDIDNVWKKVG